MAYNWTDADRVVLDAVLDQLIPANQNKKIPAAGEAGVADYLAEIAANDAAFASAIDTILKQVTDMAMRVSSEVIRQIESSLPVEFNLLLSETYKGYYSRADMRARIGVGAHPVHPSGYSVAHEPEELLQNLTSAVRARGACYRDAGERCDDK